jgi:SAM-dependent methyltransferase
MEHKSTFDRVAVLYASVRPGYPDELIEDVCEFAQLRPADPVLEVGCGAGQATISFATRGYRLTAIDPGPALIGEAKARMPAPSQVNFVVVPFETWDAGGATFKLLLSAQAWHWIAPDIAFPKAADCLVPQGVLAVFGHVPRALPEPLNSAFKSVYLKYTGSWGAPPEAGFLPTGPFASWFEASGRFDSVVHRCYRWNWRHSAASYLVFARTRSDHQIMPADRLDAMLSDLRGAIESCAETFDWPYETHLYMARRSRS